jgi:integrase
MVPPVIRIACELAYLCAMRQQDVLALRWSQVTDEGIDVTQEKTGKRQIKLWTPRLRAAIAEARRLREIGSLFVISTRTGQRYTRNGFATLWQREMAKWVESGGERFTYHDLKHKAVSDYSGDKQRFSGHKSRAMVLRYDHSPDRVKAIGEDGDETE